MAFTKVKGPRSTRPSQSTNATSGHRFSGMELSRTVSSDSTQSTSSSSSTDSDASKMLYTSLVDDSGFYCDCEGYCTLKRRAHIRRRRRDREMRPLPSLPPSHLRPLPHPVVKADRRKMRNLPKPPQIVCELNFPPASPTTSCKSPIEGWHAPIRHSELINAQIDWDLLMAEILSNDSCSIIIDL
ncbi:hypothetical protein K435DRAFT_849993 [Dendrothele bispora CBS 962.96]|uniref:Uncharacterized protein n=1 Tax=Dendrothele bispora (strain CBS 962.96) TaxID=1314807 RepID=A0A4V4HI67_DENBC|nr:hypothetical protein K435DRAFT_849993 [Dendrothele bispora CBS 962.96]